METWSIPLPNMYGDHHAAELHTLLGALPGVAQVNASSAWQLLQVEYDPARVTPEALKQVLLERGYALDQAPLPPVSARSRTGAPTDYTVAPGLVEQFAEKVPAWSGPVLACPGFEIRQPGDVHPADQA